MKRVANRVLAGAVLLGLSQPLAAGAAEQDVLKKIEALEKQLQEMKDQMKSTEQKAQTSEKKADDAARKVEKVEEKSLGRWLSIGGDYRFRYDYLRGKIAPYYQLNPRNSGLGDLFLPVQGGTVKNNSLYTNRFGLNVDAKATQDVTVHARLLMYKVTAPATTRPCAGKTAKHIFRTGPASLTAPSVTFPETVPLPWTRSMPPGKISPTSPSGSPSAGALPLAASLPT